MKKIFSFLLGIGIMASSIQANSNTEVLSAPVQFGFEKQVSATSQDVVKNGTYQLATSKPIQHVTPMSGELKVPASMKARKMSKVRRNVTASDINGYYVGTYTALATSCFDGGSTMQIVPDEKGDSVSIKDFWDGNTIRAHLDPATGVITIPRQVMYIDKTYGQMDLAVITKAGKPDYDAQITGKVTENGIDFSSEWWGIFVQAEGKYHDLFVAAYTNTTLRKPNGTMEYSRVANGQTVKSTYYVVVEQVENTLTVTNLLNWGLEVEMVLNRNRTAEITNQVGVINSNGSWMIIKCLAFNDEGNLTQYATKIVTDAAAENNNTTITWTDWSLLSTTANAYMGKLIDAKLTCNTPIRYPVLSVSEFAGSGTEADPYQISSRDHLILLADKVNASTEVNGEYMKVPVVSAYQGKYFALTEDIDLKNYRLDPIGPTPLIRFGGIFDGKGHTLKNLNVYGSTTAYTGLFGVADTLSVIKNLNVENLTATSDYYQVGGVVATCYGSLSNINVVNPQVTSPRSVAGGIAGVVYGPISNCSVTGGTVTAPMWVGGAFGECHGGISNVDVNGTNVYMTGSGAPVGGVVGNIIGDATKLSFAGIVKYLNASEQQFMGGISGYLQSGTLSNSFAGGEIIGYSNQSYVGGLVGYCRGNVRDCYSSGLVHCYSKMCGGLIGMLGNSQTVLNPEITNCYTSALTECETYQYDRNNFNEVIGATTVLVAGGKFTMTNLYSDRNITNFSSLLYGSTTAALTDSVGPKGFSADNWVFTKGAYPRVKGLENLETSCFTASAIDFTEGDDVKFVSTNTPVTALGNTKFAFLVNGQLSLKGHYASIKDNKMIEIGTEFGTDTIFIVNEKMQTYRYLSIAPIIFEGAGTAESPYLIKDKDDLILLSRATSLKRQTFVDQYFKMTNDIDLELTEEFIGINCESGTGGTNNKFQGVFDGAGYTIHRMTIPNLLVWTTPITDGKAGTLAASSCKGISGFIGRLGEHGVLKNLTIAADSKLDEMYAQCAALVGTSDGLVENCRNYADVVGYSCWVGGIVGQMNKGSRVVNCYNAGNITTGYANVGGIAGAVTTATVENCVNTGDIKAILLVTNYSNQLQRAGGISGGTTSGGEYNNCVNYGTVYAERNNAGGIAAAFEEGTQNYLCKMTNCINLGNVYCGNAATVGAIAGLSDSKHVSGTYFDVQMLGIKAAQNAELSGVTAALTKDLISGTALNGYDTELWDFTKDLYPTLKNYASETKVAAARKVYVTMPDAYTVSNFLTTGTLSDGAQWSLATKAIFNIIGKELIGPSEVDEVVADTLIAVNEAGVRRPILLQAKPILKLAGEGTATAPYLVGSVDDWTTLCSYVDQVGDNLLKKYVSLTADIDFGKKAPANLGSNGVTKFAGTLDGKGHIFKNVALTGKDKQKCALIGIVEPEAVVKNFTFEGTVNSAFTYATSVVDQLYGTLENVESKAVITTTTTNAAGVVGYAYDGAMLNKVVFSGSINSNTTNIGGVLNTSVATGHITMTDCGFKGKINTTKAAATSATAYNIGGLAASLGSADLTGCYSNGEIKLKDEAFSTTVAGLVAAAPGAKALPDYSFTNCWNATNITAGGKIAGFIAAPTTTAANAKYVFVDCYNKGDISAKSTKALSSCPTAGIITLYTPGSKFIRCHNEGTIISDFNVYAGGIFGSNTGTPGSTTTPDSVYVTDCWNEGLIIADGNQGGGIGGYVGGAVIMENCYNTADVEGNQMVGGLVSAFTGTGPQMINCYNTGNVIGKLGRVGGLIAWGGPTNGLVKGCWNTGTIASTAAVGGTSAGNGAWAIGGIAAAQSAVFEDCYNAGALKGLARVGGIVGEPTKAKTSFKNCYNAGEINAPADTCGYIVGINIDNGKMWTADNKVENCFFIDTKASTLIVPEGAKALTVAELAGKKISDGFAVVDKYTFPVVAGFEKNDNAVLYAAQVVLPEGSTVDKVTDDFNVGGSPIVTWTSNCPALEISGNDAKFSKDFTGEIVMTATAGGYTKTVTLKADKASGVDGISAEEAVSVRYYTPAGIEVKEPVAGEVYIVVSEYADGTIKTQKVTNLK